MIRSKLKRNKLFKTPIVIPIETFLPGWTRHDLPGWCIKIDILKLSNLKDYLFVPNQNRITWDCWIGWKKEDFFDHGDSFLWTKNEDFCAFVNVGSFNFWNLGYLIYWQSMSIKNNRWSKSKYCFVETKMWQLISLVCLLLVWSN